MDFAAKWADTARKAVAEQAQSALESVQKGAQGLGSDLELGDLSTPQWTSWARDAANRARDGLAQAAEKASSAEWGEQAKAWQGGLANKFSSISESAAKGAAGLSEGAKAVAGSAKVGLEKAGSSLGGMGALAMSPTKLLQSAGIFMLGMMLIVLSLSFLPLLPIAPQKFALLFALGSLTVLGSVAWLQGPMPFATAVLQRDKLVFTIAYGVGVLGTLWATLIARSYLLTSVFSLMQVVGLLYFLASFVPGGKAALNFCGRCTTKCARAVVGK